MQIFLVKERDPEMSQEMDSVAKGALALAGLFVCYVMLCFAGIGVVGYVAWHFLQKVW